MQTGTAENNQTEKGKATDKILTLSGLLKRGQSKAKEVAGKIRALDVDLHNCKNDLGSIVDEYNRLRRELLLEELKRHDLTWCSCCATLIPENKSELIFVEGRGEHLGLNPFTHLKRACPSCKTKIFDMDGWAGEPPKSKQDKQDFFHSSRVERLEDGFYASQLINPDDGWLEPRGAWPVIWKKLDEAKCLMPELNERLVDDFCGRLGLPPRLSRVSGEPIVLEYNPPCC